MIFKLNFIKEKEEMDVLLNWLCAFGAALVAGLTVVTAVSVAFIVLIFLKVIFKELWKK